MALDTVGDFVARARVILLDTVVPFRYSDEDMVDALNEGIMEGRKLRPDLFTAYFRGAVPSYSADSPRSAVGIEPMYRTAFVYYICGITQLRDEETTQDSRAAAFLQKFNSLLMTMA